MNAHDILQAAAGHMRDRAATYDKPEGERSMGATVAAFRAVTGIEMTEEQGYLLSAIAFSHGIDFKKNRARNFRNISGAIYGRLTVIGVHEMDSSLTHWLCRCECGKYCRVSISNLNSGKQMSCGCLRDEARSERAILSRKSDAQKAAVARARKSRYNTSEKGRQAQARYFEKNKAACLARSENWKRENPDSARSSVRNRRARISRAGGSHTSKDIQRIGVEQGWRCAACDCDTKDVFHVDHVVPVSAGGRNDPDNLQILCIACNLRKHTKPLNVFLAEMWPDIFSSGSAEFYHA